MILYLYALTDELDDVTGLTGVEGEPLALLRLQKYVVIGGWLQHAPAIDRDNLAAQGALVHQLHIRAASLLPMRFGSSFSSTVDAERALETMSTGLDERLARVRAREQMTIRVLGDATYSGVAGDSGVSTGGDVDAIAAAGAGARYLANRAARTSPPEIAPLLQALKHIQRATRIEAGRRPGVVATIYQLIDRGAAVTYRETAAQAGADMSTLTVRITGPSPCYAFA